ncbi:uncharacterized protein [Nicotiana tomentosiformis]|uniref:uncharacterized protein n=1 Tax=Nicotiana tomentosiformis TaxID=4098 RepID=UPI00388C49D4
MDFVVGLPRTPCKFDSIWEIVDWLTKSAHFLPVKSTDTAEQYAQLYIKELVRLYGTPISIISNRGAQFTANFWMKFQQGLGTQMVVGDPSAILSVEVIEVNEELLYEELLYEEISVAILDRQVRKLRNKEIASVKVLWRNQQVDEATWETEKEIKKKYPYLFE